MFPRAPSHLLVGYIPKRYKKLFTHDLFGNIFFDIISKLQHYSCSIIPCGKAVEAGPQTFSLVNKFYGHLTNKVKTADIHTNLA